MLNPAVRAAVRPALAGVANVRLEEPWGYAEMAALLRASAPMRTPFSSVRT